jgi:hypothetical protein
MIATVKRLLLTAACVVMIPPCGEPSSEGKLRDEAKSVSCGDNSTSRGTASCRRCRRPISIWRESRCRYRV